MALTAAQAVVEFERFVATRRDAPAVEQRFQELLAQVPDAAGRTTFADRARTIVGRSNIPQAQALASRLTQGLATPAPAARAATVGTTAPTPTWSTVPFVDVPDQAHFSLREVQALAEAQFGVLQRQRAEIQGVIQRQDAELAQTRTERDATMGRLTTTLLPDLEPASLAAAAQATGLTPAQIADVAGSQRQLEAQLQGQRAQLTAVTATLAGKVNATPANALPAAEARLAELGREQTRLQSELARYEGAADLIAVGYGTREYNRWPTWFTWYTERFRANAIMERVGASDWAQVRTAVERLNGEMSTLTARIGDARGARDAVVTAQTAVAQTETALRTLPQRLLVAGRDRIAGVLRAGPRATVAARLSPALAAGYRTWSALDAKVTYLGEIRGNMGTIASEVDAEMVRLQRNAIDWARRKINNGESVRSTRKSVLWRLGYWEYDQRNRGYRGNVTVWDRIHRYDRYDRAPSMTADDWLWWYVFTHDDPRRTRYERTYEPREVDPWLSRRPNYRYDPPSRAETNAAEAAARADRERIERERGERGPPSLEFGSRVGDGRSTRIAS